MLSDEELKIYLQGADQSFWLRKDHPRGALSRFKKKYRKAIEKGKGILHNDMKQKIINQCAEFTFSIE